MGFELNINGKIYRVKCGFSSITGTKDSDYSNNVNLRICVFDENNNKIKLDKNDYAAEKICDFIQNCINGQDTCYWDFNKPNRHFEDKSEQNMTNRDWLNSLSNEDFVKWCLDRDFWDSEKSKYRNPYPRLETIKFSYTSSRHGLLDWLSKAKLK